MSAFYDQASLVLVPSGYKSGKIYAQKPLTTDGQLTFTRASTATRVNASGLIEEVASGVPRLDYTGGGCGKLLLEPQRTNLIIYSTEITSNAAYLLGGTTNTSGQISPTGGTDAYLITEDITIGEHFVDLGRSSANTNTSVTSSFFIKPNGRNKIRITNYNLLTNQFAFVELDLATNSFIQSAGSNVSYVSYSITDFSNGWKRVSLTTIKAASSYAYTIRLNFLDSLGNISYLGDGTSGAYVYGAQQEHNAAYPTTLINTSGTAVTRVADAASKTGISSLIGQTEGTIFLEVAVNNANLGNGVFFECIGASTADTLVLYIDGTNNNLVFYNSDSSGPVEPIETGYIPATTVKIALAYKNSDFAIYVNGVSKTISALNAVPSGLANIYLNSNRTGGEVAQSIYNQVLLFKTRLTNAQLAELTTL
jgi:hypothetical protein